MTNGEVLQALGIHPAELASFLDALRERAPHWLAAMRSVAAFGENIPGFTAATTDEERARAIDAHFLATWPDTMKGRLAGDDDAERMIARMRERGETEWVALVGKYGAKRIAPAYSVFRGARDLNHFAAMMVIEAVERASQKRARKEWTLEYAAAGAWTWFALSVPEDVGERLQPAHFVEAVDAWRGRSGRRATTEPRQWEALDRLVRRLGYRVKPGVLAIRWAEWKRAGRVHESAAAPTEKPPRQRLRRDP